MKYITSQLMRKTTTDIIALPANSGGDDYILGDLHGNIDLLNQSIAMLGPNDRLFLLGDLVDRGNDSAILLLSIIDRDPESAQIFSITGNHEILTINAIYGLLYILDNTQTDHFAMLQRLKVRMINITESGNFTRKESKAALLSLYRNEHPDIKDKAYFQAIADVFIHYNNGGVWLLDLFLSEIANKKLMAEKSRVKKILTYLLTLPYIIHVEGDQKTPPFHLVHADMPFDDETLKERLQTNSRLSLDEIRYAVWARCRTDNPKPNKIYMRDNGRTRTSIITYTGHNIVNNNTKLAVREETNTVNLDVGMYYEDVGVLYCATDNDYYLISTDRSVIDLKDDEFLDELEIPQARKFKAIINALEFKYQVQTHLIDLYRRLRRRESQYVDAIIFQKAIDMTSPDESQEVLEFLFYRLHEYAYKNGAIEKENFSDELSELTTPFETLNAGPSNLMLLSMFAVPHDPGLTEVELTNRSSNIL